MCESADDCDGEEQQVRQHHEVFVKLSELEARFEVQQVSPRKWEEGGRRAQRQRVGRRG